MSGADEILDAIDHAISVSLDGSNFDGMRWRPDTEDDEPDNDAPLSDDEVERVMAMIGNPLATMPLYLGGTQRVRQMQAREPRLHPPVEGCRRYLLVGGPMHGDVMPIPDTTDNWLVHTAQSGNLGNVDTYYAHRYFRLNVDSFEPVSAFTIYICGAPTLQSINILLQQWDNRGWRPEDERPIPPPPRFNLITPTT